MSTRYDVIVLGAGGAGMMCALHCARRGRSVLVLDHMAVVGGKILISGGGRCNFTNTGASPAQFVSQNSSFCESALTRFPARSFIKMVEAHNIPYHEKKLGQLFCDRSARDIVQMLKTECDRAGVKFSMQTKINDIAKNTAFSVGTSQGDFESAALVVATGGLSIPKVGATSFGYEVAKRFGLRVTKRFPALDGFTFTEGDLDLFRELAGVSIDCVITVNGISFRENILFTHKGLSGPAALQASLHWNIGDPISIDLLPGRDAQVLLRQKKSEGSGRLPKNALAGTLPAKFVERFCGLYLESSQPIALMPEAELTRFGARLNAWTLHPAGTVGYNKAEVTRGGVDTDELSPETMEARKAPGLYFIGEVVDVTGWLGGYNFQWAWASGWAAGQIA